MNKRNSLASIQQIKREALENQTLAKHATEKPYNPFNREGTFQALSTIQPIVEAFIGMVPLLEVERVPSDRFYGFDLVYASVNHLLFEVYVTDSHKESIPKFAERIKMNRIAFIKIVLIRRNSCNRFKTYLSNGTEFYSRSKFGGVVGCNYYGFNNTLGQLFNSRNIVFNLSRIQ